ncbi:MAG: glycosyl transferase family 1, partial [Acidobacteriota bacterium]
MSQRLITIDDYQPLIGEKIVTGILEKAKPLQDYHIVHVNSTYQGGGVATILDSLTLLMNSIGIKTG